MVRKRGILFVSLTVSLLLIALALFSFFNNNVKHSENIFSITGESILNKVENSNVKAIVKETILEEYKPKEINKEEIFLNKKFHDNGRYIISSLNEYSPEWYPDNSPKADLKKLTIELQVTDKITGEDFSIKGTADIPKYYSGHFDFNTSLASLVKFSDINPDFIWEYSEDYSVVSKEKNEGTVVEDNKIKSNTFVEEKEFKNYKSLDSKTKENIPKGLFLDPDVSACGTLSTAGGVYNLIQNVSDPEICFTITGANIILNCSSYWITYGTSGSNADYGVYVNSVNNVTVKNCNILDGNFAGGTNFRPGILLESNYSTLFKNYVKTNNSAGIWISDAFHSNITNNTAYSLFSSAIYLQYSVNNTILNVNGTGPMYRGLDTDTITSNRFINSTFSGGDKGMIIALSDYNNITNCTGIGTGGPQQPWNPNGILFWDDSNYNNLEGGTYLVNGVSADGWAGAAITFYQSSDNILSGFNATSLLTDGDGISLYNSNNILMRDCRVLTSTDHDIELEASSSNFTIINCSYNNAKEYFESSNDQMIRKWYYKAYVNDSYGTAVSGANVSITSALGGGSYEWSGELLKNPIFGWNNLTDWTPNSASYWSTCSSSYNISGGINGSSYHACTSNGASSTSYIYQDVNISNWASYIDAGTAVVTAYSFAIAAEIPPTQDHGRAQVMYLFSNGTIMAGGLDTGDKMTQPWFGTGFTASTPPVGARYVRVWGNTYEVGYGSGAVGGGTVKVGIPSSSFVTNSSGWIPRQEVIEYTRAGSTRTFYNNYTINANKSGYTNATKTYNFTITQNKVNDFLTLGGGSPSDTNPPNITFESPTPSNTSSTASPVTIIANISDASNTSSFMDFDRTLRGYWSMDYYNSTGIRDNSTYNMFGTFNGGLDSSDITTGKRGNALKFDSATSDYLSIGTYTLSELTFAMWVKRGTLSSWQTLIGSSGGGGYEFNFDSSGNGTINAYTANQLRSVTSLSEGQWYHVTLITNATGSFMFINGVKESQNSYSTGISSLALALGRWSSSQYLNATLDEVMIFNRSLSAAEIKALYTSQLNKFNSSAINLSIGQHNYTVYAVDEYGNFASSGWRNFVVTAGLSVSSCQTLSSANTLYVLSNNVSSSTTCFTISASNIILDCNNYWITYSTAGADNTYGIYSNQFNTTIKNCNVVDGNWTSPNAERFGIWFNTADNGTIFNNSVNVSNSRAIYIYYTANYNNLTKNTARTSTDAIMFYQSSNNLLTNNTGISTSDRGIDIYQCSNTYVTNNNATSTNGQGFRVYNSSNSTLINNTGRGGWYGLILSNSSNGTLTNNIGIGGDNGFLMDTGSNNNILTNNTGISNSSSAVSIDVSLNNLFINITGISYFGAGIQLSNAGWNNTFINSTGISNSSQGFYLVDTFNNTLINITGISNFSRAIQISRSYNIDLSSLTARTTGTSGTSRYGIYMYLSNNTIFRDCVNVSGATGDVYYSTSGVSYNNTFINCSYNTAKESITTAGNQLLRKWYYQAYVNYSNGSAASNANVSAYNVSNVLQFTENTNASGWIQRKEVIDYINTAGTRVFWNNYTINASKSGYTTDNNVWNFTTQTNKIDDWFTLENESACGTLNTANSTYTLTNNVSSQGTCFIISANNITLDCNNYWINYSINGTDNQYGIVTNQFNTTLKNCNVVDGNWTSSNEARHGIYLGGATNGTIFNNSVLVNNSYAIFLHGGGDFTFNNLTRNIGTSNTSRGIFLDSASGNILVSNNGTSLRNSYGIVLGWSSNNTLINNIGKSNSSYAIYFSSSSNNTLLSNNGTSDWGFGFYILSSSNNNFTSNTGTNGVGGTGANSAGIRFDYGSNNTLVNNTGTSNTNRGIYIYDSDANILVNNTGVSSTSAAVQFSLSENNTISNLIAKTTGAAGTGIVIYLSNNSLFRDCINVSGYDYDIYVYSDPALNNTFINCSYDTTKEDVNGAGNILLRKWYYQAYVNYSNGSAASNANVSAYNVTNKLQFTEQTNASGWIQRKEVIDYINTGGTRVFWNNYTINASKTGYTTDNNIWNFTTQTNKIDDWFTLENESACGTLNTANSTYTLTNNVSSQGTCFIISANNITLDCNNYWINYSINGTDNQYGAYTNQFNTTIKNCNVVDGNWTSSNTERHGIYFYTADNGTIFNNSVNVNNSAAIYLYNAANYNNLTRNTGASNTSVGISIETSSNYNALTNNTGTSSGTSAIFIYDNSMYNTLINNNGTSRYAGLFIYVGSSHNNIINNTFTCTTGADYGIYVASYSNNNTFINNIAVSNSATGTNIYDQSVNNTFIRHTSIGNIRGIYIHDYANNTLFRDCITISGVTSDIYQTVLSINSTFINCSYNSEEIGAGSQLIRKWYYQAYVNYSNGSAASNANVSAYNVTNKLQFTEQTNVSGWIQRKEVIEYNNTGGTRSFYNNYTIFANKSGYTNDTNIFNFTVTQNKINDFFTLTGSADTTPPTITFEYPPTPVNASSNATNPVTIVANISDQSNTSSWIDIDRTLMGYWAMDYYNSTVVFDNSTYINNGTFKNGLSSSNITTGVRGNALTFDGVGDYLNCSAAANLDMSNNITIAAWVKSTNNAASYLQTIVGKANFAGDEFGYFLSKGTDNKFYFNARLSGYTRLEVSTYSDSAYTDNSWHHLVGVLLANGRHYLYVDGVQQAANSSTGTFGPAVSTIPFSIGTGYGDGANVSGYYQSFTGSIDSVHLYNRTLSSAEIKALYSSQINKFNTSAMTLANGQHNYTVYAIDEYGNANNSGLRNFVVTSAGADTIPPTITFEEPPTPENGSTTTSPVTIVANISDESNISSWIDLDRDLLGYWAMDYYNTTGIFDNSSYGRFAEFYGSLSDSDIVSAKRGYGLNLTSADYDRLSIVNESIGIVSSFTTSSWVKSTMDINGRIVAKHGDVEHGWMVARYADTDNFEFRMSTDGSDWNGGVTSTSSFLINNWYHVVTTYNGTFMRVFINGVEDTSGDFPASVSGNVNNAPYPLRIGTEGVLGTPFNGIIDEVMIFNRSLSQSEIKALYSSQINKFNTSAMGLADGQHNYTVYAIDEAGNVNNSGLRNFVVTSGTADCTTIGNSGSLDTANGVYTLTQNVTSSTTTCLTVAAANVTLDCNGYWINYSTAGTASTRGVYSNQINTTIKNCNIVDGNLADADQNRYGIYFAGATNGIIYNNFVHTNNSDAIFLVSSSNFNNLTNNTAIADSAYGIDLTSSSNNNLINNNASGANDWGGIILYNSANNNTLINNTGTSDTFVGIRLYLVGNNTLINSTGISSNTGGTNPYGIYLQESSNNTLINSTGISNDARGISISYSFNNTLTGVTARTTGTTGTRYGIYIRGSNHTIIRDCVNVSGADYDVYYYSDRSFNNTFINCSYNIAKESVSSGSQLIRKWYYQAYVNYSNGTLASGANVSAYNVSNKIQFTELTNSSGWIQRKEVIEYNNTGGTRSFYNNYTIFANKSGYTNDTNIFNFTVTQNKINDFFTLTGSADTTPPTIAFESPTPSNTSSTASPVTIVANISDESNTSAFIDFDRTLILWLSMEGNALDNSSYNWSTTNGGATFTDGKFGQALTGFSSTNKVTVDSDLDFASTNMTISFWLYIINGAVPNRQNPIGKAYGGDGTFTIEPDGTITFFWGSYGGNDEPYDSDSSPAYTNGTWEHWVMVRDRTGRTTQWYKNGVADSPESYTSTYDPVHSSNDLSIGDDYVNPLNGSLDELLIFNRTLSSTEIKALYSSQINKFNTSAMTLADGQHNYTVYAMDESGNQASSGWRNFIVSGTGAGDCGILSSANTLYVLSNNVSSTGTCFTVTAANITLDCNNYWINYSINGTNNQYGVVTNQFNTTIRNCKVVDGNWSTGTGASRYGIYFNTADNGTLLNNFVNVNNSLGIYLYDGANFNNLTFNRVTSNANSAIYIDIVSNSNKLINNNGTSNQYFGIYLGTSSSKNNLTSNIGTSFGSGAGTANGIVLSSAPNNTLNLNTGISNISYGIYLSSSSDNNLTSNVGISNTSNGIYFVSSLRNNLTSNNGTSFGAGYGIYLFSSSDNNILRSNNGTSSGSVGIILSQSSNNNLTLNIGASFASFAGISLLSSSDNNTLISNSGTSSSGGNGINLIGSSNNRLTNNTGTGTSGYGIVLATSSNNNTLTNNTGTSTSGYGIYLGSSSNNTLINNTGTSTSSHGIYFLSSENCTLTGNNGISLGAGQGLSLDFCSGSRLTSNNGTSVSSRGISITNFDNITSINDRGNTSSSGPGFFVFSCANSNFTNINGTSFGSGNGITLGYSFNTTLTASFGSSNTGAGISLSSSSSNNTLINSTGITGDNAYGIYLGQAINNTLINNTGIGNGMFGTGIWFYLSINNTLINNTATSNFQALSLTSSQNNTLINQIATSGGTYGISIDGSNGTIVRDCRSVSAVSYDIYYSTATGSVNNTFINCSYNLAKEHIVGAGNELIRKWYYKAYVNYSNGTAAYDANVTAYNVTYQIQFTEQTNASGWIQRKEVIDYINIVGTRVYWNNYTINASKTGYGTDNNIWNFTTQTNKIDDVLTLDLFISSCIYSSGNWIINCSEGCAIGTNYDVGGNNITIMGVGTIIVSSNITNYNKLHIEGLSSSNICTVRCVSGGCFKG